MAKFTPYGVTTLPTGGSIDLNGIYFLKQGSNNFFSIHIRKADNSGWVALAEFPVMKVNGMLGDVSLDLAFSSGVLTLSGSSEAVNLDARYKFTTLAGYGITDAAYDDQVVHRSGDENVGGVKSFSQYPLLPEAFPSEGIQAASKQYVDKGDLGLQGQIDALASVVATGVQPAQPIDCSANPNYPAAEPGERWRVTVPGRIGGASGEIVKMNELIECLVSNSGGTQTEVGMHFTILQANLDSATEATEGYIRKATTAEVSAGVSDVGAVTPAKLQAKINASAVKYDTAQSLTEPQKTQARNNIGAASASDVEWGAKEW